MGPYRKLRYNSRKDQNENSKDASHKYFGVQPELHIPHLLVLFRGLLLHNANWLRLFNLSHLVWKLKLRPRLQYCDVKIHSRSYRCPNIFHDNDRFEKKSTFQRASP